MVKSRKISSRDIGGYDIYCPKHGYKSARYLVDNPTKKLHKQAMEAQQREILFPNHADCGTFTIIQEIREPDSSFSLSSK